MRCYMPLAVRSMKEYLILINGKKFPRIDYWEIAWDDVMASGDNYEDKITWQVSFYSRTPENEKADNAERYDAQKGTTPNYPA